MATARYRFPPSIPGGRILYQFIALQILEKLIQTKWNALPREQCDGIKNYVVSIVIKTSSDEATMRRDRMLLNKMNLILVKVPVNGASLCILDALRMARF